MIAKKKKNINHNSRIPTTISKATSNRTSKNKSPSNFFQKKITTLKHKKQKTNKINKSENQEPGRQYGTRISPLTQAKPNRLVVECKRRKVSTRRRQLAFIEDGPVRLANYGCAFWRH